MTNYLGSPHYGLLISIFEQPVLHLIIPGSGLSVDHHYS
jgi:hypothetical protein